jgi:hypothetical protein
MVIINLDYIKFGVKYRLELVGKFNIISTKKKVMWQKCHVRPRGDVAKLPHHPRGNVVILPHYP